MMKKITLVVGSKDACPDLFSKLSLFYAAQFIELGDVSPELIQNSSLVLVDFADGSGKQLGHLKRALEKVPNILRIGCVTMTRRQEVVQAKALGLSELWDRECDVEDAVTTIKTLIGDYAMTALSDETPDATRDAVNGFCSTMDEMAMAVATNRPLPMKAAAESVQGVVTALQTDGLDSWLAAVQSHHSHTFCHSMMVTGFAVAFANALELDAQDRAFLSVGALVHDLGKVRIPLSILDKPGELTREEYAQIKLHPVFSKEILDRRPEIAPQIRDLAVQHHEYLDGTGYPDGLGADQISRLVRILTICDIYAALTEKRSYKESFGPRQAYSILLDMKGRIDQDLLRRFRPIAFQADVGMLKKGVDSMRIITSGRSASA
ncbi:HD domain-containing phosphohydrolase [Labrenzia sp. CE80]|uniref:HD-GYP domain-containing protein n=1 Tax=Labrenzia sp. CE80 TaxID=1788986 RepID=UPI00129B309A|nr:HD domain-containing phosphohydrolase [Labrenzia sp. CE80]